MTQAAAVVVMMAALVATSGKSSPDLFLPTLCPRLLHLKQVAQVPCGIFSCSGLIIDNGWFMFVEPVNKHL